MQAFVVCTDVAVACQIARPLAHSVRSLISCGTCGIARAFGTAHQLDLDPMMVGIRIPQEYRPAVIGRFWASNTDVAATPAACRRPLRLAAVATLGSAEHFIEKAAQVNPSRLIRRQKSLAELRWKLPQYDRWRRVWQEYESRGSLL